MHPLFEGVKGDRRVTGIFVFQFSREFDRQEAPDDAKALLFASILERIQRKVNASQAQGLAWQV